MGFIAGICSRDQSDISTQLYNMAIKLRHRGNSAFCVFSKEENGWKIFQCNDPRELLDVKISFGLVGRHLFLDENMEEIPYSDCHNTRFLLIDGRIFNISHIRKELENSHQEKIKNSGVILHIIEELQKKVFDFSSIFSKLFTLMEGMFAAALILKEHVFIFRDLIGIKPLYLYVGPKYIAFASEKKALWSIGLTQRIKSLRPGRVVRFAEIGFTSHFQAEFTKSESTHRQLELYRDQLLKSLKTNISNLIPQNSFYLLLSGGLDSTILATLLKQMNLEFKPLVLGSRKSKDIQVANKAADFLNLSIETLEFDEITLENLLPLLLYHVESRDEKKINIAFPLFYASKYISEKQIKILFTGQGADELFGGYKRHEILFQENPEKLVEALWEDIRQLHSVNLQRDDAVAMAHMVELRLPYLSRNIIEQSMQIPISFKIQPPFRKVILRQVGKQLGLPEDLIQHPKRAIQFSSGSYNILKKLARTCGFTKNFALKHSFFSPTQLFIDSLAYFLGFPHIDPQIIKFYENESITWPDSFWKYENMIHKIS